VVSLIRTK